MHVIPNPPRSADNATPASPATRTRPLTELDLQAVSGGKCSKGGCGYGGCGMGYGYGYPYGAYYGGGWGYPGYWY
jgi:hypothetical protein